MEDTHLPFMQSRPTLWFAQLEAKFHAKNIVGQWEKFYKAVAKLPQNIAIEVEDIIHTPPQTEPYDVLKAAVISRTSISAQKKLQQLLNNEHLGDRKPTQLLRSMRSLAGPCNSDSLLQHIFLQRLPQEVQPILAVLDLNETDLDKLAEMADKIMERSATNTFQSPTIAHTTVRSSNTEIKDGLLQECLERNARLEAKVDALARRVDDLVGIMSSRGRQSSPNYRQSTHPARRNSPSPICHYHSLYGKKARSCIKPCAFKGRSEN